MVAPRAVDNCSRVDDSGGTHTSNPQRCQKNKLPHYLPKTKEDVGLQEKLKSAADLDTAVALAKEAGFDVSKADWLKYYAKQTIELSDEELEGATGGTFDPFWWTGAGGTDWS